MHDAVVVEVLQREDGLSKVHLRHVHGQRAHVLQQRGTIPPCGNNTAAPEHLEKTEGSPGRVRQAPSETLLSLLGAAALPEHEAEMFS